jgi:ubiquinol-cytochrome c reductase cytochrome b subunit
VIDLGGAQRVIEFGWFRITVANLVVVVLMVAVFILAVALPFPKGRSVEPETDPEVDDPGGGWTGSARRWARLNIPWGRLLPSSEPGYVASWTYTFGVMTLTSLGAVVASGLVLAAGGPGWRHTSSLGEFVDAMHLWSVQLFFFFMILHLAAQFLQASWRGGRGLTWVVGVVALLVSIFTALTGYVSQQNFEAQWIATQAKDGLNAVGVGALFNLLDTEQVLTVHVMFLPLAVALAVGLHLLLVRLRGVCPPIDGETSEEVTP